MEANEHTEKEEQESSERKDRVEEAVLVVRFPLLRVRLDGSCDQFFAREP